MIIEYFEEKYLGKNINIEDIGNCAIECLNESGQYFYVILKTTAGQTEIITQGPVFKESSIIADGFFESYNMVEFNLKKLSNLIFKFLNNPKYKIIEAQEIPYETAINNCINILDFM